MRTLLLTVLLTIVCAANSFAAPRSLILDAGHGGFDGGAVAADGTVEKDLNLSIAKQLEQFCALCGIDTVMVRTTDTDVGDPSLDHTARKKDDLHQRLALFEKIPDAWVLSIHQNRYSDATVRGAQMFYGVQNPDSLPLADAIQRRFWELDPAHPRVTKEGPTSVFLLQQTTCPMVLCECGFLSNPEEVQLLQDPRYQSRVAFTLLCGVLDAAREERTNQ